MQKTVRKWNDFLSNKNDKRRIANAVIILVLSIVSVSMLFPLFWMLSMSFKPKGTFLEFPPVIIPKNPTFRAYIDIWSEINIFSGIKNTMMIILFVLPFGLFCSSIAGFAFSKLNFTGKRIIFMAILSTIMIPFPVTMIPLYRMFDKFGMVDTLMPLIIPGMLGNVGAMFFIMQYLKTIPNALMESAKIDGASYVGIFFKIILPLIKPAVAAQAIFIFMGVWNDLLSPVIYLSSQENFTLQYLLATLESFYATGNDYPMIMAGGIISLIPLIVMFVIFQKFIIDSLAITGLKG